MTARGCALHKERLPPCIWHHGLVTYFLIFLAVIVAAVASLYVVGLNKPKPEAAAFVDALEAPVASLPPVLLPGTPEPADVDRLRFSLGLRGYRMDQVDEVLDRLRDELAAKDVRIAELESALAGTHDAVSPAAAAAEAAVVGGEATGPAVEAAVVGPETRNDAEPGAGGK